MSNTFIFTNLKASKVSLTDAKCPLYKISTLVNKEPICDSVYLLTYMLYDFINKPQLHNNPSPRPKIETTKKLK